MFLPLNRAVHSENKQLNQGGNSNEQLCGTGELTVTVGSSHLNIPMAMLDWKKMEDKTEDASKLPSRFSIEGQT